MLNNDNNTSTPVDALQGKNASLSDPYGLDFNKDGHTDLLWRNQSTGDNVVWLMQGENGNQYRSHITINPVDKSWSLAGIADFNQDGKSDLVWRNQNTGQNVVWHMDGANNNNIQSWDELTNVSAGWNIKGIADFNEDGSPDLLWRNQNSGQNVVWYMGGNNNSEIQSWDLLTSVGRSWDIKGVADFNKDGSPDLLWRNQSLGLNVVWHMGGQNNTVMESYSNLTTVGSPWDISGVADFNKDNTVDIFWRNQSTGQNVIWHMQGPNSTQLGSYSNLTAVGGGWQPIVTGWAQLAKPEPPKYVTLIGSPNTLQAGSIYDINWTDNLSENIRIDLYKDGRQYSTIARNTASDGHYRWTTPNSLAGSNNYQIRISSETDSSVSDVSDRTFSITAKPTITVNALNSGNPLTIGNTVALTWSDNISGNVKIDLYKGNQFARTITSSTPSNGRYNWRIPNNLATGSDYRLKITSTDNAVSDFSNNSFVINPKPAIAVTSPSERSTLILGSTVALKWNDNLAGNVKIELYEGSQKVQTITNSTSSDGLFNWTIPTNLNRSDSYRIKVTALDGSTSDFSDSTFTITPQPILTVNSPDGGNTLTAGNTVTLRWSDNINGDVNIELYKGTQKVQTIASVTPSDGRYDWRIPDNLAAGSDYRLKI